MSLRMISNVSVTQEINKIVKLVALKQHNEALVSAKRLVKKYPKSADLYNIIGAVYVELKDTKFAIKYFHKSLKVSPNHYDANANIAKQFHLLKQYQEAITYYQRALKTQSNSEIYNLLATALGKIGYHEKSILNYQKAIEITPSFAQAHHNLGVAYRQIGNFDLAKKQFESAVNINPTLCDSFRLYSGMLKLGDDDKMFQKMKKQKTNLELSPSDKIQLNFALGKAELDIGNIAVAFKHFQIANGIMKSVRGYNITKDKTLFESTKSFFTHIGSQEFNYKEKLKVTPFFIIGMPRSGTTLIEQIISMHPNVHGAGELEILQDAIKSVNWQNNGDKQTGFAKVRNIYKHATEKKTNLSFICDKMPANFRWVGFIRRAFPEAKIIHISRNPIAVCWSNYRTYFPDPGMDFGCSLEDVASYHNLHNDLIRFWEMTEANPFYALNYEDFTEAPVTESKKLFQYLDLGWDNSFLEFYKKKKPVLTASDTQIRQQIYRGSSKEWEKYKKFLKPTIDLLNKPCH